MYSSLRKLRRVNTSPFLFTFSSGLVEPENFWRQHKHTHREREKRNWLVRRGFYIFILSYFSQPYIDVLEATNINKDRLKSFQTGSDFTFQVCVVWILYWMFRRYVINGVWISSGTATQSSKYSLSWQTNSWLWRKRRSSLGKIRQRCATEFCVKLGEYGNETFQMLQQGYAEETMSRAVEYSWWSKTETPEWTTRREW